MAWKLVGGDFWKSKDKSDHLKAVICSGRFPNCMRYRTIASSHSVFEKLFVQLHPKSYYCIISQFWKSSSFYVQKSPVCTQAPNWLHPGTPSASEDPFKIYYSRPHKRQEQSENLLEMCSPVILGVTTIHVVGEANTYIYSIQIYARKPNTKPKRLVPVDLESFWNSIDSWLCWSCREKKNVEAALTVIEMWWW